MRILLNICNVHIDMHVNKIKEKKLFTFFRFVSWCRVKMQYIRKTNRSYLKRFSRQNRQTTVFLRSFAIATQNQCQWIVKQR